LEYEIVIGDSRVETKKLPSNRYKAIITSPPYNVGKSYAGYVDKKMEAAYQILLRDVFRECYRVMRDDGLLFINLADEAGNWFRSHDVIKLITSSLPYIPVHRIIWKKPYVQALATEKHVGFAHEFIFVLAKTNSYTLKEYIPTDVWEFYERKESWETHPAVFPVELPIRCSKLICGEGDWILDPFAGTGTTMLAARHLNLNSTIIELSSEYLSDIKRKVRYGQSLKGGEHFKIYQDGLIKEEIKLEEPVSVSWDDETDMDEERMGIEKWL
jgi:DNA modification methylase